MLPPIHIAGHGRSGTTILGELFQGVDNCHVVYEQSAKMMGAPHVGCGVENPQRLLNWLKIYEGHRVVDKEPRNAIRLAKVCEVTGGKGIHIMRDGRDYACSVVGANGKRGITTLQWLAKRVHDQWDWTLTPEQGAKVRSMTGHVIAGMFWAKLEDRIREGHNTPDILAITYEDLIRKPGETARLIARHVDVDADHLARRAVHLMTDDPLGYAAAASSKLNDPTGHTKRIGRWREQFTELETAQLRWLCGETYEKYGYSWEADDEGAE